MGLFDRLKQRLGKTRSAIGDGLSALFRGGRPMDEQLLDELEEMLYGSDLGPLATDLVDDLKRRFKRGELKTEDDLRATLRERLVGELGEAGEITLTAKPHVVLVVGVNGSGKTTTIAKLARRFREQGHSVLIGACDTFRAAAADQLEVWAERTGAAIVRKTEGADPAAVAFDTVDRAARENFDVVLVDTAGRLHTQTNLMAELEKIRRVIAKRLDGAPHSVLLVLDGTNGQNAIAQAKLFTASVEVTGLAVTKLDGTARGGAVFAIRREIGLPVQYIGTGERAELLEAFEPGAFADAILSSAGSSETAR
ncbi:Signal recognition particle receptor FtsY [Planctomycetes bacterium Pla163]|uniref:Signal recognition particle receptor FtsY n=1 Tax=Rohdeia mirabilis TaxID=2528008 RepID=A0A518D284_9BACT|nr:Signal recognition particle receptor FtsY [Planctomycetes bacterium Pla163]